MCVCVWGGGVQRDGTSDDERAKWGGREEEEEQGDGTHDDDRAKWGDGGG